MQIITINLPEKYLETLQILQDIGKVPSRSEAVRIALRDFLIGELEFYRDLDDPSLIKSLKTINEEGVYWK